MLLRIGPFSKEQMTNMRISVILIIKIAAISKTEVIPNQP